MRATSASAAAASRAMWVWCLPEPDELVAHARARRMTRLFVAVPVHVATSPQLGTYVELIERAHRFGIDVDALGGDPAWIDHPKWIVDHWLAPALRTEIFDGVHVDVEPYGHPEWDVDRTAIVERYLALLDALAARCHDVVTLEADVAHWFHEVRANGSLAHPDVVPTTTAARRCTNEPTTVLDGSFTRGLARSRLDVEVLRRVDAVTVLAYRNRADGTDGTIAIARPTLAATARWPRPVRIGQETNVVGSLPDQRKQTFYGHTRAQMEQQLTVIAEELADSPCFAGVAIHDHAGDAALAP